MRCEASSGVHTDSQYTVIGNESVPTIIINNTIYLFLKTAIGILIHVISNHSSFRVLFDKIVSVYFISKIYLYFSTVPTVSEHFRSL